MRLNLHCHPLSWVTGVDEFWVSYSWEQGDSLCIKYVLKGSLDNLNVPSRVEPERADGLWKNTCFELFLRKSAEDGYCEFNFSPSGRWSAYQFSGHREGMTNLFLPKRPEIVLESSDVHITLDVTHYLPDSWRENILIAAFSAVIADKSGAKSYWALSHPPGKPDFHHKDGFAHQLKAADSI
ncbi:DOMON-like domain-containing protein [Parasphingorhabdus sp. JC815]|uniref:DOMON-like domain-containing protein n=1 Tax=Parasphingorhabdus sp. JC815 TaxID=3232140 RepID=UPI0034599EB0